MPGHPNKGACVNILDAALGWAAAGASVVPAAVDGTKTPAVPWKPYQTRPADHYRLRRWFTGGAYDGFGVVCGAVSGHLELFEMEGRAVIDGLRDKLATALSDHALSGLWGTLNAGYVEITPGGGFHWYYRVDGHAKPNTKLARRLGGDGIEVLVETRGEGGFSIVAPSAGRTHPTGAAWVAITGRPATIPTISEDDRDALYAVATLLDEMPVEVEKPPSKTPGSTTIDGERPGDDYNQRADWTDILSPHRWVPVRTMGHGHAWRRPGKDRGISATTGQSTDGVDRLYVFSTSTPFDSERPYSKFAAYACLCHGGDFSAAARELRGLGYGRIEPSATRPALTLAGVPIRIVEPGTNQPIAEPHTDLGNARRLVATYGHHLRYVPAWGKWFIWDGRRWAADQTGNAPRVAKAVARQMLIEAQNEPDQDLAKKLVASAKRAESDYGIKAMLNLAGTETGVALAPADLDAHPALLNTTTGVLDLATGQLVPHNQGLHLTKITQAGYDPDARAPEFATFLERVQPDPAMREFLARLLGHTLTGQILEHLLAILHGVGANGKTTLTEIVRKVLGDYAATTDPALLIDRGDAHPTGVADLFGRRLAITHETDAGRRLAEGTIKRLTGGDQIKARRMREDFWEFDPTHSIIMVTNHRPIVTGDDEGIWRRLRLVPFDVVIPVIERDPKLPGKLAMEMDGILGWLVAGYQQWISAGLAEPDAVTMATKAFRIESDALGRFLDERCLLIGGYRTGSSDLFTAWNQWCGAEHLDPGSQTTFSSRLVDRGFDKQKSDGRMVWHGIGLQSDENDESDRRWSE